ncbi:MAG: hypothetical protein HC933_11215 [Pleurocapsa sp. SU_196_0]|nr:hypothetical protein [Pleurocapsa sp. SU_196_0]
MAEKINLADPEFEPTDEQLVRLSKQAFSGIKAATEEHRKQLRARIAMARAEAFRQLNEYRNGA